MGSGGTDFPIFQRNCRKNVQLTATGALHRGKRDHGDNLGPTADMNLAEMKMDFILGALK